MSGDQRDYSGRWALLAVLLLMGVCNYRQEQTWLDREYDRDCADFVTQAEAQDAHDRYWDDPWGLDPDADGWACEDM